MSLLLYFSFIIIGTNSCTRYYFDLLYYYINIVDVFIFILHTIEGNDQFFYNWIWLVPIDVKRTFVNGSLFGTVSNHLMWIRKSHWFQHKSIYTHKVQSLCGLKFSFLFWHTKWTLDYRVANLHVFEIIYISILVFLTIF